MNAPGWLVQVGGPNAITRWTWVGSIIATVASAGLSDLESPGSIPPEWWLVLLTSVMILGLSMWLLKHTVLPGGRLAGSKQSRPAVAMTAFIGFGIERAVTLTIGASIIGFDERFTFVDRLVFGIAYSIVFGALIALVVATVTKLLNAGARRVETAPTSRRSPSLIATTRVLLAALLLGSLGTLTWHQGKLYRDPETLWRDTVAKNPNASMAHINLGNILDQRGDLSEAIPHFRAVIEADPPEPDLTIVARAYYNLGNTLGRQGKIDEAIEAYQGSLRVDQRYYNAYRGLGWAFQTQGRVDESIEAYQQFLRVFPDHAAARRNLDDVLAQKARRTEN